jgi:3-hydroxyisobutyrate dehydrogenase-like beta-hydroxyacid dehydrogenase
MSEITVIGLGNMGSALARALLESGCAVTVWNRSLQKAAPLADNGAVVVRAWLLRSRPSQSSLSV